MINRQSYEQRAESCPSSIGKKLFYLMAEKNTNLALSADVTHSESLLQLAETLGPEICVLKTHIDIIEDFTPNLTRQLRKIANYHRFLIFEDRKFADIGNTVKQQYAKGIYRIAEWADLVNAHVLPGPDIIRALSDIGHEKGHGLVLLAEMSSNDHLMTKEYTLQALRMAEQHPDFVIGFITQHALSNASHWVNMTPGIHFEAADDSLGQQYITPDKAITEGADIIIVGRGILQSEDTLQTTRAYKLAGWKSYLKRCEQSSPLLR